MFAGRLPSVRDLGWLAGQVVVLVVVFVVAPRVDSLGAWTDPPYFVRVIGLAAMLAGPALMLVAAVTLRANLVPQPTPVADGKLIEDGPYGVVRHPIYSGLLLLCAGVSVQAASVASALAMAAAIAFFVAKSGYEERLLIAHYPGYSAYQQRVPWRLCPPLI